MKIRLLSLALVAGVGVASVGCTSLTEKEAEICRARAANQQNEFSARQAYEVCAKGIRKEIKDAEIAERERAAEAARQEELRTKLSKEMSDRCKSVREQWTALREEREKYYQRYLDQAPFFWEAMREKYGTISAGRLASDYPIEDQKRFEWVYWYGELMKKEEALMDVVFPPGDSRFIPKDKRTLDRLGMDSCSPDDLLLQVKV